MSVAELVPKRPDDLERIDQVTDVFVFAPSEPLRNAFSDERAHAVGRLLCFVALVGLGAGVAPWIAGEIVAGLVRGLFS